MEYLRFFEIEADYKNASIEYPNVSLTIDTNTVHIKENDIVIMTLESNPEAMTVCYYQGWAKNPYYMTKSEAEAVTDIGTAFLYDANSSVYGDYGYGDYDVYSYVGGSLKHFDEFKYFTNVTSIDEYAFSGCTFLTSIEIPNMVTSIGEYAFFNCYSLTSITIGNSVTSIGNSAFASCNSLSSITIPNSVTSIGDDAFNSCYSLSSITIPNSVTSIGIYAFSSCNSLREITIPSGVTSIGIYTFYGCTSLTSITIPNSVTSIGANAFYSCTSLSEIICLSETAPTVSSNTFSNIYSNGVLKVPNGSNYSSWMSTSLYYLGYYNWTKENI